MWLGTVVDGSSFLTAILPFSLKEKEEAIHLKTHLFMHPAFDVLTSAADGTGSLRRRTRALTCDRHFYSRGRDQPA